MSYVTHAAGVHGVGQGIRQLSLSSAGDATRGPDSQRRGALRYVGPNTRPAHVADKRGLMHTVIPLIRRPSHLLRMFGENWDVEGVSVENCENGGVRMV